MDEQWLGSEEEEKAAYVPSKWDEIFEVLKDEDCQPLSGSLLLAMEQAEVQHVKKLVAARRDGKATGQSKYRIPWIWYKVAEGTELELNDGEHRVREIRSRVLTWRRSTRGVCEMPSACNAVGRGGLSPGVRDGAGVSVL